MEATAQSPQPTTENVILFRGVAADTAPGTGGGEFLFLNSVQMLDDGTIGLPALITGGTGFPDGIFKIDPRGIITEIILSDPWGPVQGTVIPGSGGATFWFAGDPDEGIVSFNQAGNFAFTAESTVGDIYVEGVWKWERGQLGEVLLSFTHGDIAPGTGGGEFADFYHLELLNDGTIGLMAEISGGATNGMTGLFKIDRQGIITDLVLSDPSGYGLGTQIPGTNGASFSGIMERPHTVSFNQRGHVAFLGKLGPSSGVWTLADGQFREVLRLDPSGTGLGDIAPGTGGETFERIFMVELLDDGSIGFAASGRFGGLAPWEGLFLIDPNGVVRDIVIADPTGSGAGTPIPGGQGETFRSIGDMDKRVDFNQAGDVVFVADTVDGQQARTHGLWTWVNGEFSRVLQVVGFGSPQGDIAPRTRGGMFGQIIDVQLLDDGAIAFVSDTVGGMLGPIAGVFTIMVREDGDGDGVPDVRDNCPTVPNPEQERSGNNRDRYHGDACVHPTAVFPADMALGENPMIGADTIIEEGVIIGDNAVIGSLVKIESAAYLSDNVIIGDGTSVGPSSAFGEGVVLNRNVLLAEEVEIGHGVWIGEKTDVGGGSTVGDETKIGAAVTIDRRVTIGSMVSIGDDAVIEAGVLVPDGTEVKSGAVFP